MLKKIMLFVGVLLLCACSGKTVSHDNYQKVKNNMTMSEVTKILGKPSSERAVNIAGLSTTTASWKTNGKTILVTFVNNKVTAKNFTADHKKK